MQFIWIKISTIDIWGHFNDELIAELRKVIPDLTRLNERTENGETTSKRARKRRRREQAAREGGDLRADHVFMQRVSGIVISP